MRIRMFIVLALVAAAVMVTIDRHRGEPRYTQTITIGGKVMFCEGKEALAGGAPNSWRCRPIRRK